MLDERELRERTIVGVHGPGSRVKRGHTFRFEGRGDRRTLLGFLLFNGLPFFGAVVVVNITSVVVLWLIVIAMVLIALESRYIDYMAHIFNYNIQNLQYPRRI